MKRMKLLSFLWGLILFSIFGLLTAFGIIYNNKNKIYKDMEGSLVNATKKYVEISFAYPKEKEKLRVDYTTLKENKLIDDLKVDKDKCNGYAIVQKNNIAYEYKGYVKCKDYTTKNYEN